MAKIALTIKNCQECPKYEAKHLYTADSFEYVFDMLCLANGERKIAGYVNGWEMDKEKVPEWCPLLIH